jgi:ABC-2 type transport system permease protein
VTRFAPAPATDRVSRPAAPARAIAALAALELRLLARRGENLLVTMLIPVAVLVFFTTTNVLAGIPGDRVAFLVPGSIALAVVATGLVSLGISTAYDRSYGVLKRLGGSPLPRWGLVAAKVISVLAVVAIQVAALAAVATLALGWSPGPGWSPVLALVAIALGTLTFAGLGLLLAGSLRAEAVLALANGLFIAVLMLGGIVLPVDDLPAVIQPIASILPATALAELLRIALDSGAHAGSAGAVRHLVVLLAWAVGSTGVAIRTFRWD